MHRFVVLAAATLGFAVATLARDLSGANCGVEGLGYFACYHPFPQHCVEQVSEQAVAFCSRYLSSTTTATATASQISVVVKTLTTTAVATTTEVSTALITSPTSTTTTTSYEPPEIITVTVKRRDAPHFCPRIYEKILSRKPADKISSVCSCLGVTATTVTRSTTRTTTSTTTSTSVTTSVSTTTTTTITTSTTGIIATQTAVVDYCDVTYTTNNGNIGTGNAVLTPGGITGARDCCLLCWNTLDCVAAAFTSIGECQLLVKSVPLDGAPTNPQCPLGVEDIGLLLGPGNVYRGPCSPRI